MNSKKGHRWRSRQRSEKRPRNESGLAGVELLPFGFLIFVLGVLFFGQVWAVVNAKSMTESASREAARSFVESTGDIGNAAAEAQFAAEGVVSSSGRSSSRATVTPVTPLKLERCALITYEVSYKVPLLVLPHLPSFGDGIIVKSSHTEIVDPFRSGLDGEAGCV